MKHVDSVNAQLDDFSLAPEILSVHKDAVTDRFIPTEDTLCF